MAKKHSSSSQSKLDSVKLPEQSVLDSLQVLLSQLPPGPGQQYLQELAALHLQASGEPGE